MGSSVAKRGGRAGDATLRRGCRCIAWRGNGAPSRVMVRVFRVAVVASSGDTTSYKSLGAVGTRWWSVMWRCSEAVRVKGGRWVAGGVRRGGATGVERRRRRPRGGGGQPKVEDETCGGRWDMSHAHALM
jgi:hypothetical protein